MKTSITPEAFNNGITLATVRIPHTLKTDRVIHGAISPGHFTYNGTAYEMFLDEEEVVLLWAALIKGDIPSEIELSVYIPPPDDPNEVQLDDDYYSM